MKKTLKENKDYKLTGYKISFMSYHPINEARYLTLYTAPAGKLISMDIEVDFMVYIKHRIKHGVKQCRNLIQKWNS